MNKNVLLISLGCDKNRIDAEIMAGLIENAGYTLTDELSDADCVLINTCGFIDPAKQESLDVIFDMVREKEDSDTKLSAIIVTGCLAQRYCKDLTAEIPEIDAVAGLGYNGKITEILGKVFAAEKFSGATAPEDLPICGKRFLSTPGHYAYLKIAEGCSNRCTYCAIPMIRGHYRSRPMNEIIEEANELIKCGVKELILVAQDTTVYGRDLGLDHGLSKLLKALTEIEGLWKVRLLYAYPDNIDSELIETIAASDKIAKYIDMPLQHASAQVLKRMNRYGNAEVLKALVERIRARIPDITLRTTFMVGFPGETEEQFDELVEFAKVCRFGRAGCFEFSSEEGTPASRLNDDVSAEEKQKRSEILMRTLNDLITEERKTWVGKTVEAICDGFDEERSMYIFRSEHDSPDIDTVIYALGEAEPVPGDICRIRILDCDEYDLFGQLLV